MRLEKLKKVHQNDIMSLLLKKFETVYASLPELPEKFNSESSIMPYLEYMLQNHSGYVLVEEHVEAFIFNIYIDKLFYDRKGVYTPEWGHYFFDDASAITLLKQTYIDMAEQGYEDHSISVFNNQNNIQSMLFDNCYGSRCMDSHFLLKRKENFQATDYCIQLATSENRDSMMQLLDYHHKFMNESPNLLGFEYEESSVLIDRWLGDEKIIIWVAMIDGETVGIMKTIRGTSEGCDASADEKTLCIGTTQISDQYRRKGIGKAMLFNAINYAIDEGFNRMAVDYETQNPTAQNFWPKYFTPTIRSLVRNIGKKSTVL